MSATNSPITAGLRSRLNASTSSSYGEGRPLGDETLDPSFPPTDFALKDLSKDHDEEDKYTSAMAEMAFTTFSTLTSSLMTHPLVVFRNQAQITSSLPAAYHLMPYNWVTPLYKIYRNQGVPALWKGVLYDFIISVSRKTVEVVVSEHSSLPITPRSGSSKSNTVSTYAKHLVLKAISIIVATPIICSAYTLRVQSNVVVDEGDYMAVFREGYTRLIATVYSTSDTSHMIPLYHLVLPITALSLGSYVAHIMASDAIRRVFRQNELHIDSTDHDEVPVIKTLYDRYFPRLMGIFVGRIIADVTLYPLSTVTGRLIVQGTRTFIDDVQTGNGIIPVSSQQPYTGLFNAVSTIRRQEGILGFYKGFGAMVAQYGIQFIMLRAIHVVYERVMELHYPRVPRRRLVTANLVSPSSSTHSSVTSLNTRTS